MFVTIWYIQNFQLLALHYYHCSQTQELKFERRNKNLLDSFASLCYPWKHQFNLVELSSVWYGWVWFGGVELGLVCMSLIWCGWVWFNMDELVWCGWVHFGVDEVGLVWLSLTVWVWFGEVYFCFVWKMTWIKMLLLTLGWKTIQIFFYTFREENLDEYNKFNIK